MQSGNYPMLIWDLELTKSRGLEASVKLVWFTRLSNGCPQSYPVSNPDSASYVERKVAEGEISKS